MPARRRSRQRALQSLYQWDMRKGELTIGQAIGFYYDTLFSEEQPEGMQDRDAFMEALARRGSERVREIDSLIERHASNWRIERMPVVDRNVLRVAVCELLTEPTPPAVVIDEAIELARRYSGEEAVRFVNGVLDAIYQTLRATNLSAYHLAKEAQSAQMVAARASA